MKQFYYILLVMFCFSTANAATESRPLIVGDFGADPAVQALSPEMAQMGIDQFLSLTPKKYRELTGKKPGIKNTLKLKAAQKVLKRKTGKSEDIPKGLYIVLAIFGWAWLAMGLMDDWEGNNWWVNLLLTLLCWLPGVIHAFVKMDEYY